MHPGFTRATVLHAGESFEQPIGHGLVLRLVPNPEGWRIEVGPAGREDYASVVTPPLHGLTDADVDPTQFVAGGHDPGRGAAAVRHVDFAITAADFAIAGEITEMLMGWLRDKNGNDDAEIKRREALHYKAGHCWLKLDHVVVARKPPGSPDYTGSDDNDLFIGQIHFAAECGFVGRPYNAMPGGSGL
jgi:hypothetical protein